MNNNCASITHIVVVAVPAVLIMHESIGIARKNPAYTVVIWCVILALPIYYFPTFCMGAHDSG